MSPFKAHTGEWLEATTGWQYNRERFYDPEAGRWNRMDDFEGVISDPLSLHKYLYTHADPVNGIDPSGLFTLGSLGVSMSNMTSRFGSQASASFNALRATNDVRAVIQTFTQMVRGVDALWDTINAVRDAIDLLDFDPSDLQELANSLRGKLVGNIKLSAKVEINFPVAIERKFRRIFGNFGKNPLISEWIGSVSAALVANIVGFESSLLRSSYHGIDALMKDPRTGRFVVLEAKGGSSPLRGQQMRDSWISSRLRKIEGENRGSPDAVAFRRARLNRDSMWAMVVRTDLFRGTNLAVRIQTYPGVKVWGSPFD